MTTKELIKLCYKSIKEKNYIHFPTQVFAELNDKKVLSILKEFSGKYMMMLPDSEIAFFEWLKIHDEKIWIDLWHNTAANDDEEYLVSVDLLPVLLNKDGRGFPICDLVENDNYYFTEKQMVDEESKIIIEVARKLFKEKKELSPAQMLALEISLEPIDIWHFAYRHKINLAEAKAAVHSLVADGALVHLKEAEYVARFVNF
ncbi:MAG: hypothetical protein ACOX09_06700 [Candidatus Kapaibacterium sp.]|jgi:hypothetical protein